MKETTRIVLDQILDRARTCENKGRLYKYEQFKQELMRLDLNSYEFEQACIKVAKYLEV